MSSEPPAEPVAPAAVSTRRFRLTAAVTLASMFVLAVVLTGANAVQGPRLMGAELNTRAVVERAGQRLVLRLDQAVGDEVVDQIAVNPEVPIKVSLDRASLVVRFSGPLRYGTVYEVAAPLRSTATGATSALRYSFRTPDARIYALRRAAPGSAADVPDEIVRAALGTALEQGVYSEPRIEEYAVSDPVIAIVTQAGGGLNRVSVGPLDGSGPMRELGSGSLFSQLQSSGPGGLIGFVRTTLAQAGEPTNTIQLELYDTVAGGDLIEVVGLDGKSLDPQYWAFVPGTTSIVLQTVDGAFYLVDPINGAPAQPLGSHLKMHGFVHGSPTMIVEDPGKYTAIDLATGSTSALPAFDLAETASISRLLPLDSDRAFVALVVSYDGSTISYSIASIAGRKVTTVYQPPDPTTQLLHACLSPNAQYISVEAIPSDATPDGYEIAPGYATTHTVVIDTATGDLVQEIPGFGVDWCAAT